MTRNFTLLLLALVLCACAKEEIPEPVSHLTDYQPGKTYVQTFFIKDADPDLLLFQQLYSVDSRLVIQPDLSDIWAYSRLCPSNEAMIVYSAAVGMEQGGQTNYLLAADIRFTFTDKVLRSWDIPLLTNVTAVSRWRLVTVEQEVYTFNGIEYPRYKIVKELHSFAPRTVPKDDNPARNDTITRFNYGQVYHQQFLLDWYQSPENYCFGATFRSVQKLSSKGNLSIFHYKQDNKAALAPIEMVQKVKELCKNRNSFEYEHEHNWYSLGCPYTLAVDLQFRYARHWKLPIQYLKRTSDWKLVRETFDNEDSQYRYWIEDDGKDPRNELIGSWDLLQSDNQPIASIVFNSDGTCRCTRQQQAQQTTEDCEYTFEMPDRLSIRNRDTGQLIDEFRSIRFNSTWDIFAYDEYSRSGTFHRSK